MKLSFILFLLLAISNGFAQVPTQTITGRVIDKDTQQPLVGAAVMVSNLDTPLGGATDTNGKFIIENVPVGRRILSCQYVGYAPFESDALIINSTQSVHINIELGEDFMLSDKVVINAYKNVDDPVNELAVVSTRSFSPEETERFAASINDPSRMALSFPGVQQGIDDNENDIIIRGNSSIGMLWRLEGVDIPNPNHFARPGTSGGGITIFSARLLSRSDFSSGAMPAEYGNALSGAFDVNFRKGNLNDRQYSAKVGMLGLDFMAEGPIKPGQSSYLANYRYSTLGLLSSMGIYIVGERVTNKFQDLSFNLLFQGKSGQDFFTIFGLGGLSEEHYMPVEDPAERVPGQARDYADALRNHSMGATGFTYTRLINSASYLKVVAAVMGSDIQFKDDTLDMNNNRYRYNTEIYKDWRIATAISYSHKFGPFTKFQTGLHINQIFYDYYQEELPTNSSSELDPDRVYGVTIDGADNTQTIQYYAQISQQVAPSITLNAGVHVLGLMLTNDWGIDPRLSMQFELNSSNRLSFAYGLHSQIVPLGTFFYQDSLGNKPNNDLNLMRTHHLILGYKLSMRNGLKFGAEFYYQHLFQVPIRQEGNDEYWMLNSQSGYPTFALESKGTGDNLGADFTLEKSFSKGFFMLLTGSVFKSTYRAQDPVTYNSKFNTKFVSSYSLGQEFEIKGKNTLQIGGRVLFNGGFRYTPYDPIKSAEEGRYVPLAGSSNSEQVPSYFRIDTRISYRMNNKKLASVLSLDIQNITNRSNPRAVGYNAVTNETELDYHSSGLVPILSYQVDF